MANPDFTAADIRRGETLFKVPCTFVKGVVEIDGLPRDGKPEIAFAGRSNVGKSSLINALTGQKSLARVSVTPGRTRELNFFTLGKNDDFYLVDMPGYGYAEAPKQKVAEWTKLIHAYLKGRANLARVYVLVDARHGLKDSDAPALDALGEAAVSHQIVLTKADQLNPKELADRLDGIRALVSRRGAAFPDIAVTSALKGQGIPELRAAIARLVAERKH